MNQYVTGTMIKRLRENKKLYPEGGAEARFKISRTKGFFFYCNKHSLFRSQGGLPAYT